MDNQADKTQPSESEEASFSVDDNFTTGNKTIGWLLCCCLKKVEKNKMKGNFAFYMKNRHSSI